MATVPLHKMAPWSPFTNTIWFGVETPITEGEIRAAIEVQDFRKEPLPLYTPGTANHHPTREDHIGRIAWLVITGWEEDIWVDVGIPDLGYYPDWIIQDGNHRLGAAFYRQDATIGVAIGGDIDYAEEMFGIEIESDGETADQEG